MPPSRQPAAAPDPGDLSRRLAARREGLRLSVAQVAARARVSREYLGYLESRPGHPEPAARGVAVLPVNYVMSAETIVFRTDSGSLIAANADGPVSFEADHFDLEFGQGWSVLVHGLAHRVLHAGELRFLRSECDPRPWPRGDHDRYIRIVPSQISGRRIRSRR